MELLEPRMVDCCGVFCIAILKISRESGVWASCIFLRNGFIMIPSQLTVKYFQRTLFGSLSFRPDAWSESQNLKGYVSFPELKRTCSDCILSFDFFTPTILAFWQYRSTLPLPYFWMIPFRPDLNSQCILPSAV